jgi:hypothetical protein
VESDMNKIYKRKQRSMPAPLGEETIPLSFLSDCLEDIALGVERKLGTGHSTTLEEYLAKAKAPEVIAAALLNHARTARADGKWKREIIEAIEMTAFDVLAWQDCAFWGKSAVVFGSAMLSVLEAL